MSSEKGNALFLILIAVALFAALSYAITQSGRGGGGIEREQAEIAAAQMAQYAAQIEQAIMRMQIVSGCSDAELSFYYDSNGNGTIETDGSDVYYNVNSPSPDACHVFSNQGGSLVYQAPDSTWLDGVNTSATHYGEILFTGGTCVPNIGSGGTSCDSGGDDEEIVMFIPYISEAICQNIADVFDVVQPSGDIPIDQISAWTNNDYYTGSFTATGRKLANTAGADTSGTMVGKQTGCFEGGGTVPASGTYHFYHVVAAR